MKRTALKQIGKRGRINIAANKKLEKLYFDKGIMRCEICGGTFALSWHHRHKRWWYYKRTELLSALNQTLLLDARCHQKLESNKGLSEKKFEELRGPEDKIKESEKS